MAVNHPSYYQHASGVECIDVAEHFNFNVGNALKYIWRADEKGGLEDLAKADWYIQREIQRRAHSTGNNRSEHSGERSSYNAATTPVYVGEHVRVIGGAFVGAEGRVVEANEGSMEAVLELDGGVRTTEPVRFLRNRSDSADTRKPAAGDGSDGPNEAKRR